MFCILSVVVITRLYIITKVNQTTSLMQVSATDYNLYLNKYAE